MSIQKEKYQTIIENIRVGNSIAEDDSFLRLARVETPVFTDVLNDKYDIILGRKGSGKTAIFKIITLISDVLLLKEKRIILSGVNSSGESIFNIYKKEFDTFTEEEFENFWKLYFISLIDNGFIKNNAYEASLSKSKREISNFYTACYSAGIPAIKNRMELAQIVNFIMNLFPGKIKKASIQIIVDAKTPTLFTAIPTLEFNSENDNNRFSKHAVYVSEIGKALRSVLEKSDLNLWVILDRLDEVFPRFSQVEFLGLRGLLRAYNSFDLGKGNDFFRIKLFLRDDVKSFLTDADVYSDFFPRRKMPSLTAATHIFSKESPTLEWSEDEIEQLILSRLMLNNVIQDFLGLRETKEDKIKGLLRNKASRKEYWDKIFPPKIGSSYSLKWIFTHLKDSNDVVTPRCVIEMLEEAINFQRQKLRTEFEDSAYIFTVESIKRGLTVASKNKLEKDIFNEFINEQGFIKKLSSLNKHKFKSSDLKRLYGKNSEEIVKKLRKIGVIKYITYSHDYRIPYLFRPALDIKNKF